MRRTLLLAALLAAAPALADPPMSAEAFERYAMGKTLFFGKAGIAYGAEQYLPGRRVIWTFLDGDCQHGEWYEAGGQICFVYEARPDTPQCWSFFDGPGGLTARFENDPEATQLVEVEQSPEPLLCPGPEVGV
ncbi:MULTISPECIES: hypothetical protein [Actibacterium]|uniref:DUF995 domain-containing protein n=1 Tax=Actibacterium naphthalenivorans TaxID=1614693 RepID=A0A840CAJ8_9RHOB|nr:MULTISPECIES: hypothetical protein [Actibacterium]ALG90765.1 hypothetical protein TQ29_11920 [Actibacterium sp. EMB200-NS6]MBB4023021.1 hypothetical protein [Actibacterium naphthalenivorans]